MFRGPSRMIVLLFSSLLFGSCFAQTNVRVIESKVRIQFHSDGTLVVLPVENQTGETLTSDVHLELIDPQGAVRLHSDQSVSVPAGSTKINLTLPAFARNENPDRTAGPEESRVRATQLAFLK